VYDVGEADGQSFIVMEHVEGQPLSELIPADGLPLETVIRYGTQIADGLAHAHEQGIIHRDLKSANVVITPAATVKLIDFGIAVARRVPDQQGVTTTQESPVSSTMAGTLVYMAPETLRGQEATARTDIWALGVLLYEMASGGLPFEGEAPLDVAAAIAKDNPRPLPSRVSPGLRGIIMRCLQKEAGSRYTAVVAVQSALETIQSDAAVARPDTDAVSRGRRWRPAAMAAVAAAAGLVAYVTGAFAPTPNRARIPRLVRPFQLTADLGLEESPTWSPDGRTIAYSFGRGDVAGGRRLDTRIQQISSDRAVDRTADQKSSSMFPQWSPDGSQIAFFSRSEGPGCYVMPALGGPARKVLNVSNVSEAYGHPVWSSDSTRLGCVTYGENVEPFFEIVTLASNASTRLSLPGASTRRLQPAWSQDGQYLAYIDAGALNDDVTRLWVMRASDGVATQLTSGRTSVWSPQWARNSRTLFFVSNGGGAMDLWQQTVKDDTTPAGEPVPLTTGIGIGGAFAFSPDESKLAYSKGQHVGNVWRVPMPERGRPATWADAEQVTHEQAHVQSIDLSADGSRLLVSTNRRGPYGLWSLPAGGGDMTQVTLDLGPDWAPRWSPDGQQIAFYSYRSGNRDIWVMPVQGGPARQLTTDEAREQYPTWSPNGQEIVFVSMRSGNRDLWVIPAGGGTPRQLTDWPNLDSRPRYSPDGQWIAFASRRQAPGVQIWRIPSSGGEAIQVTRGFGDLPW
ncbi:MAG TPA: protein kinase, partial [Vicinamibacterales bacterium]|nr:protein kinase [Vicinamibacterales bacterium]